MAELKHNHKHEHTKEVIKKLDALNDHIIKIKTMVEENVDCTQVLYELADAKTEIINIGKIISDDHISHCIAHAVKDGDQEAIDDLLVAIGQLIKP